MKDRASETSRTICSLAIKKKKGWHRKSFIKNQQRQKKKNMFIFYKMYIMGKESRDLAVKNISEFSRWYDFIKHSA